MKEKKTFQDYGREWLDTLVVAFSVAMAFRAYFFEPFNIPTGSMQPTLWGNHSVADVQPGWWDSGPQRWLKWLVTGERYADWKTASGGSVRVRPRNDGYCDVQVGLESRTYKIPMDAAYRLRGAVLQPGETIFRGLIVTGDFIFVNRWWWNFVRPRTGDVMIFSTTGVGEVRPGEEYPGARFPGPEGKDYKVQQYTHYIKRMKATPGETYALEHPVQGFPASVTMGADEYFACGDNFGNSLDSRYWGPVPGEKLRGIGSVVFWPVSGWRKIR